MARVKIILPSGRTIDQETRNLATESFSRETTVSDRILMAEFESVERGDTFESLLTSLPRGTVVSVHECAHHLPPDQWYDCKADPRARYRERTL